MTANRLAAASTAQKVIGSLAVLGTAAAVAGLGTYGSFTDTTTPVDATVTTGTVDIDLTTPAAAAGIPLTLTGFVPGDSMTRTVNLVNKGTVALSSVTLASSVTSAANVLTTDATNGLQLSVKACSVPWTQAGTAALPTLSCTGLESVLSGGPVSSSQQLSNPASLQPGGTDHIAYTISLPTTADNAFQGKSASLKLVFTGVQRAGSAR